MGFSNKSYWEEPFGYSVSVSIPDKGIQYTYKWLSSCDSHLIIGFSDNKRCANIVQNTLPELETISGELLGS